MAKNPFDQFDPPKAANPFDQFDEPAAPPQGVGLASPAAAVTPGPVREGGAGTVLADETDRLLARYPAPQQPGFFSQMGKSFGVGVDQAQAAVATLNTVAQDAAIKRVQQQLAQLEASGQGNSPQAAGLRKTLDHYTRRQGRFVADLAKRQAELAGAPVYEGVRRLGQAQTFSDAWDVFKSDPLNIIANLGAQSMPTALPGLIAGLVNPALGAATMGGGSAVVEFGSSLMQYAADNGVNVRDAKALEAFFANPQALAEGMRYAGTRAGIIGVADAAGGFIAGKTLVPKSIKGPVARGATNLAVQMPTQAATGAGGEAGAQVATVGGVTQPGEVVAEAAGGLFTAPLEVGAMATGVARERRVQQQRQAANGGVPEQQLNPAQVLADTIQFNADRARVNTEATRQAAVDLLNPANAQVQAAPQRANPFDQFDGLVGNAEQQRQPTPTAPTNMAAQPTATVGQAPVTAQAGPGFNAASVQQMLPQPAATANATAEPAATITPPGTQPAQTPAPAGAEPAAAMGGEFADLFDEQGRPKFSNAQSVKDFKKRTGLGQDGVRAIQAAVQEGRAITLDEARQIDIAAQERRKAGLAQSKAESEAEAQKAKENAAKPAEPRTLLGDFEIPGLEGATNLVRVYRQGDRTEAVGLDEGTVNSDLTGLIQAGKSVEEALATLYGDHGPNEAPNPDRVKRVGQSPTVTQPAPAGGTPVEGAGESRPTPVAPSPLDGLIDDLPPESQAQLKELERLVNVTGFKVHGTDDIQWHMVVRGYKTALEKDGPEAAAKMIANTMERVRTEGRQQLLDKAYRKYIQDFDESKISDSKLIAAVKNGTLDISGESWAPNFYEFFKIDPAKIERPQQPVDNDRVGELLLRMRAGALRRPSMASVNISATPEERAAVEEMNRESSQAYEQAARQFLEGELPKAKPAKDNALDIALQETLRDVSPLPIEKSAPVAKDWLGTLKVADIIAAKKDIRSYLKGIHLNEAKGRIEATDGHRAVIIQADLTGKIPPRPEGVTGSVIVNADGTWGPDGVFPQMDRVLPDTSKLAMVPFSAAEFGAKARGMARAWSMFGSSSSLPPAPLRIGESQYHYNANYLADMADVFRRLGYDTFNAVIADKGLLAAVSPDGRVTQVVMPMRMGEKDGTPGAPTFFAPIVGQGQAVRTAPAAGTGSPVAGNKPARKRKAADAVLEILEAEGIDDPVIADAVAAEYDRLTGDEDVPGADAEAGDGLPQRGDADEAARVAADRQQADEQPDLLQAAENAGRPAPRAAAPRSADPAEPGAVNDRTPVPAQRNRGAEGQDRGRVRADDGRQENQLVKGSSDPFRAASFTDRQSIWRDAFQELGLDPAQAELLPPARQYEILSKGLRDTFGLALVEKSKPANIRDSIDQLLDAYRNLQFMAHVLDLPAKAIGLDSKLALGMTSQGKFLGAYFPLGTNGSRDAEGLNTQTPTIILPGRSNSFAHEWGHALDYFIVDKYQGAVDNLSGMVRNGESLSDQFPETVRDSFRLLMNAIFFDQAEQAAKIMDLERRIEASERRGVEPTKLKAELERIRAGASQSMRGRSEYYQSSRAFDGRDYWVKPTEMLARSFEAYIAHKVEAAGGSTEFIAKGDFAYLSDADRRLAMTFPKNADRFNIFRAYDLLFDAIRAEQLLGSGPAAERPQSIRLSDPAVWFDAQLRDANTPAAKRVIEEEKRAWRVRQRQLDDLAARPADTRPLGKRFTDAVRAVAMTNRGVLLALERQYRDNPAALAAIRDVMVRIATDPGSGRETFADGTYAEAVTRNHNRFHLVLANIVREHNLDLASPDTRQQLADVLTAISDEPMHADPAVVKAAAPIRELLTNLYYYNRNAGLDIGFVENGYLPRLIDEALVTEKPESFIADATRVYQIVFERDTERPADADDITVALKALEARMKEAGLNRKDDPRLVDYNKAKKALNRLLRKLDAANASQDGDAIDAAQAELQQWLDENMDVFEDAYDMVRDVWSSAAAAEYQTRISYGSPESFSSHSPAGSFLKERTLPPEADKILANWYIQDPVERVSRYIDLSVRKAEYNRRFGRDHRTGEKNTKLYRMLEAMVDAGMRPQDRAMVEKIVGQVTGTDRSTMPVEAQRLLGNIHALGQMTLLGRVVLTSIAEPITVAIQTGRPLDALKSLGLTIQEIFNTGSVRERRALANALGIVGSDLASELISNRLGGTVGEGGMMQRANAQFFRRIGLTGLTNAQRRSAMQLAGRYVLDLAHTLDDDTAGANEKGWARDELRDAGLTDEQMDAFVAWTREFADRVPRYDEVTDVDGSLTEMGKVYAVMVGRLVNQAIQNPTAIDRPWAANTIVGRLTFGLLSFNMAFFRNVMLKSVKKIGREMARGMPHATYVAAVQVMAPLAMLYAGHFLVTMAREALLNPEKWEEHEKKEGGFPIKWLASLAFSRSGFTGLLDPIYNAVLGVKYQRDLANILTGPSFSYFLQALQRVVQVWLTNSPNTNSAERAAARGVYELSLQPLMAFGVGYLPGGPLVGYGLGAGYAYLSSPAAKSAFQNLTVGPADSKKAKTGDGGDKRKGF